VRTVRGQGEPPLTLVTDWTSSLPRP
jgi:hypothetical protein